MDWPRSAQAAAMQLAWEAISGAVRGRHGPGEADIAEAVRLHPQLAAGSGVFTTIYVDKALRGCLGELEPAGTLAEALVGCARRTPSCDRRFTPVMLHELARVEFKLSLLSPLEPLPDPEAIELGKDGLLARHRGRIGVLLPEVPVEHGMDRRQFLATLWRKAGLEPQTPACEVELLRFSTLSLASGDFALFTPR